MLTIILLTAIWYLIYRACTPKKDRGREAVGAGLIGSALSIGSTLKDNKTN